MRADMGRVSVNRERRASACEGVRSVVGGGLWGNGFWWRGLVWRYRSRFVFVRLCVSPGPALSTGELPAVYSSWINLLDIYAFQNQLTGRVYCRLRFVSPVFALSHPALRCLQENSRQPTARGARCRDSL